MAADDPLQEQFKILRQRARQAATAATQQEREGLQRRFAALGQVGSGAQIRAEAQASERGAQRLRQAEEGVGLAELAARQQRQEIEKQRQFQSSERQAGQSFAAEQAGLGRQFQQQLLQAQQKYATGERLSSQDFAALQAGLGREFATQERLGTQQFASQQAGLGREFATQERLGSQEFARQQSTSSQDFQARQADLSRFIQERALRFQDKAFDENVRQFELEFARDSGTIDFNKAMAELNANKTFLDELGITGTFKGFRAGSSGKFYA